MEYESGKMENREKEHKSAVYKLEFDIKGGDFVNAGMASTRIKDVLKMLGIPPQIYRRVAIIAYEAEMNLVIHAGGGKLRLFIYPDKVEVITEDNGPGIEDIELAMKEGYSTAPDYIRELGFGAGMGLPNIKKNADDLIIKSEVGKGTYLKAIVNL